MDFLICQTSAASPAEPGELLFWFRCLQYPFVAVGFERVHKASSRLRDVAAELATLQLRRRRAKVGERLLLPRLAIAQQSRATTATETAWPMVPGALDGERQLLRTGLRQGAGRYSEERLVSSRLARERQLLHPLRCEQRHCAPARLGRGGFSEAAMPHYRSAHQRRFPEPLVREIEERFGNCLDTDHSAGRGNGMSGIVAGKQPNEAERVHRGERAPRRGLDCRPNVRAEPHR